jgi:hypothetical protein
MGYGNLYIDFSEEEVKDFLTRNGYIIKDIIGEGQTRVITGNDGGGGVELSDIFRGPMKITVAVPIGNTDIDTSNLDKYLRLHPQWVFKEVLKHKVLKAIDYEEEGKRT